MASKVLVSALAILVMVVMVVMVRGESSGELNLKGVEKQCARSKRLRFPVLLVFAVATVMWSGESFFQVSAPVVSFLPIVVLAATGVIKAEDVRCLPWDVLLLLAGGLSL